MGGWVFTAPARWQAARREVGVLGCTDGNFSSSACHSLVVGVVAADAVAARVAALLLLLCLLQQVVGMGLLLTFIGMQTSKIVVPDKETMVSVGG